MPITEADMERLSEKNRTVGLNSIDGARLLLAIREFQRSTRNATTPCDEVTTITMSSGYADPSQPTHCDHGVSLNEGCDGCRLGLTPPDNSIVAAQPSTVPSEQLVSREPFIGIDHESLKTWPDDELQRRAEWHSMQAGILRNELAKVWRHRVKMGIATEEDHRLAAAIRPVAAPSPSESAIQQTAKEIFNQLDRTWTVEDLAAIIRRYFNPEQKGGSEAT